ncbi:hypothetical protein OG497_38200 [Streptomyces sp. NBC_01242]|uniref:hypothetical protein n=1 Tax=Streptomyces sp. NBC_01242 TaxID=2903795 RepID=UPI00225A7B10|nr:hypothetical protein [Streptomyces sp. NBC_01242]MCX4799693.1 hypothetical protein [Streptomyces sp. NBC_01242]
MTKEDRNFLIKLVSIVVLVATIFTVGIFAIRWATADVRGKADKREQTIANGAFRIATYEEFFDLCASVQSAEQKVKVLEEELAAKPSEDRAERIRTSIAALKATRADSIATYNSKASQEHRTAFQDAALPYHLDNTTQETQCAA